jgi:hypothetical protein
MGYYLSRQFRNALQGKRVLLPASLSELDQARARIAELEALLAVATVHAPAPEKDSAGRRPRG